MSAFVAAAASASSAVLVQGSMFRDQGLGFGDQGLGSRVEGSGFRDPGIRV